MAFGSFSQEDSMMSEINVTPLVDVMLVLLIVFIVTAPLLAPQALKINLPKTQSVATQSKPRAALMTIDAQGKVTMEKQPVNDEQLAGLLQQHAADPEYQLQIEADQAVSYGRVAALMAIAQRNGVARLSFMTVTSK